MSALVGKTMICVQLVSSGVCRFRTFWPFPLGSGNVKKVGKILETGKKW